MYVIVVKFEIHQENVDDFRPAMIENAETSLKSEKGCRQFDVCWDKEDDTKVFLYEIYDDKAAFDAHLQSDHFRSFDERVAPWVANKEVSAWERAYPTI